MAESFVELLEGMIARAAEAAADKTIRAAEWAASSMLPANAEHPRGWSVTVNVERAELVAHYKRALTIQAATHVMQAAREAVLSG